MWSRVAVPRGRLVMAAWRGMGSSHHHAPEPAAPLGRIYSFNKPGEGVGGGVPVEGSLAELPENDLYIPGDPNYVFKGTVRPKKKKACRCHAAHPTQLPEEAELADPYAMTPDEEPIFEPAMAARHLGLMFCFVGTIFSVVYITLPSKPTTERKLDYAALDRDLGGSTHFATAPQTRSFRSHL